MLIGHREKGSQKLHAEIHAVRRKCLESVWHIRDKLLPRINRRTMQGKTVTYMRAITDCLEMYLKELVILNNIHRNTNIFDKKKEKSGDVTSVIFMKEMKEVSEVFKMLTNNINLENMEEEEGGASSKPEKAGRALFRSSGSTPLCCSCFASSCPAAE